MKWSTESERRGGAPRVGLLMVSALALGLVGCTQSMPPPDGHITPPEQKSAGSIPEPVLHSSAILQPKPLQSVPRSTADVYSIGVSDMPVRDLLYALAQDAKLNLDIHPGVKGRVTLNAIEQTLPRILERLAQQVDLRFEVEGDTLVVSPDKPFLRTYHVDYINVTRTSDSRMLLNNKVATGDLPGSDSGDSIGSGNGSTLTVDNYSRNQFWHTLVTNIEGILGDTSTESSVDGEDETEGGSEAGLDSAPAAQQMRAPENVFANPQSGLISVRANSRQHAEVQSFLDKVLIGARRQVRIEATLVEVELSDAYQQGIDWSVVKDLDRNDEKIAIDGTSGVVSTGSLSNSQITPQFKDAPNFVFNAINPASGISNITATVHGVTSALRYLKEFGNVRVLSTPRLVTLNNQMSVLKVVDNEVYFTIEAKTDEDENTKYTSEVHTVPVGLVMNVLPQISPNDEVTLIVRPTITRIIGYTRDPNPGLSTIVSEVPRIQVRELESILSVNSGNTAMIGGLMQNKISQSDAGLPGLSAIPVLGNFFNYKNDSVVKTELIVFLRPTVIHQDSDLMHENDRDALHRAHKPYSIRGGKTELWGL
ncbi:MAG: hypothetical protein HQL50_02775 [Magnetococcales bacterium]|nr:hypothetical protein [Magnetococcales bacterium]